MFQRILVGVDGSDTSVRGLDEAIRMAKLTGGTLHIVHVLEQPVLVGMDAYTTDLFGAQSRLGAEIVARMKARALAAGVDATTFVSDVLPGRVCDVVIEQVSASGSDLVVLGTHGRHGIGRMLMGSDAEQILRAAAVPVLLVRAPDGAGDAAILGAAAASAAA